MNDAADLLARAYRGEGALFHEILDSRARELAVESDGAQPSGIVALVLRGEMGRWALPLTDVGRVDPVPAIAPVPFRGSPLLGLGLMGSLRCLLVDIQSLVTGAPLRPRDRPGHAVVLRGTTLAVVADEAEGVARLTPPAVAPPAVQADGVVWLSGAWLTDRLAGKGA